MTQFPLNSIISGSASLGEGQPLIIGGMTKQTGFFERIDSLRTRRHFARFLESIRRARVVVAAVGRGFLFHDVRSYVGGTR